MSAILQRLYWGENGALPVVQFLHRDETLFAEPEWNWKRDRAGAHLFATHALAEAAAIVHAGSGEHRPFAVVCRGPDIAARDAREADRIATAMSSFQEDGSVCRGDGGIEVSPPRRRPDNASAAVRPELAPGECNHGRQSAGPCDPGKPSRPKRQPRVAGGAERWKKIYREKVARRHVSPAESYAELERRHLD